MMELMAFCQSSDSDEAFYPRKYLKSAAATTTTTTATINDEARAADSALEDLMEGVTQQKQTASEDEFDQELHQ